MGCKDVADKMKYLTCVTADNNTGTTRAPIIANTGAKKRLDSIVNADARYCIEKMLMPFFNSGYQYIPTNNTLRIKVTRESNRKILTMSEHNYDGTASSFTHGVANASGDDVGAGQLTANLSKLDGFNIKFSEFYMHFKHVTPSDLIQSQINLIEKRGRPVNVFAQEVHVKTTVHNCESSKFSCNDIFSCNIPYMMILGLVRNDYYNGDAFVPQTYFS